MITTYTYIAALKEVGIRGLTGHVRDSLVYSNTYAPQDSGYTAVRKQVGTIYKRFYYRQHFVIHLCILLYSMSAQLSSTLLT